ncbi:hypothetical protein [Alteromonas antoniana]|uniref:hypothetical protein n=1 Tax=Alteromonas antoniana TaxID=2803813 RepID=UPI001C438CE0|nr:hypothetical protein [Alteromonas antoniana]
MSNPFEIQLEGVIKEYSEEIARSKYDDGSDVLSDTDVRDLQTRCLAAIERSAGKSSVYYERVLEINRMNNHIYGHLAENIGVARSLLSDIRNGYMKSLEEIIHGEVFSDFLEMAEHLKSNGYKDAAAVVAGSTLEAHIRQLCQKHSLTVESGGKPKKTDTLNAELVKSGAYGKLDQKNVTAWLGLRNSAAHGAYSDYDTAQVNLLIGSIREFISRNPA